MIVSSVTKTFSGYYHCSGTNLLGETNSDQHQVDVLCEYIFCYFTIQNILSFQCNLIVLNKIYYILFHSHLLSFSNRFYPTVIPQQKNDESILA